MAIFHYLSLMKFASSLLLPGLLAALAAPAMGQAPPAPPPPGTNLIRNGGFEATYDRDLLWDGVDKDGFLAGERGFLQVLNESGNIAEMSMPVAVALADINGDGLVDIITSDPLGYVRAYINQGTPTEPKFTHAEMSLPFLAVGDDPPPWWPPDLNEREREEWGGKWLKRRQGVRIGLADLSGAGRLDLVAGNYFGEVFYVRNAGTPTAPNFAQPSPINSALVPTTTIPNRRWGNVFSPLVVDWNGNGLPDLLLGEGSYSANNIHLFLNQGSQGRPVYNEKQQYVVAFGDGREQLTPTVVDYNGDGVADLLVADRLGRIAIYLGEGAWKPDGELKFAGYIGIDGNTNNPVTFDNGIATVAARDINGDGLFDLLIGKNNGRLVVGYNTGTKEEPKFSRFTDLRGENKWMPVQKYPSQWDVDIGLTRGNFYAFCSAVTAQEDASAQPPEGSRALRLGYLPSINQVFPRPQFLWPGVKGRDGKDFTLMPQKIDGESRRDGFFRSSAESIMLQAPNNYFILRQIGQMQLEIGANYTVSFKVRGSQASKGLINFGYRGFKKLGEDRLVRGDRGAVRRIRNEIFEEKIMPQSFVIPSNWQEVSYSFRVQFDKQRDLNKEKMTSEAGLEISFQIGPPDGYVLIDDVKVVKAP